MTKEAVRGEWFMRMNREKEYQKGRNGGVDWKSREQRKARGKGESGMRWRSASEREEGREGER